MVNNKLKNISMSIIINNDIKESWLDKIKLPDNYKLSDNDEYMNDVNEITLSYTFFNKNDKNGD